MKTNSFNSEIQNRSERLVGKGEASLPPIDLRQRWKNRRLSTSDLLGLLRFQRGAHAGSGDSGQCSRPVVAEVAQEGAQG